MATTNDLKNGLVLNLEGQLWTVVEFQHVKPGKGGVRIEDVLVVTAGGGARTLTSMAQAPMTDFSTTRELFVL